VLIANDAERVQNSCSIQLLTAVLILASIAAGQMFNRLAQTLFRIKFKSCARDSLVMAAGLFYTCAKRHTMVTISVSFCIALADCPAAYLVHLYLLTKP
jgi:hypothetical protein